MIWIIIINIIAIIFWWLFFNCCDCHDRRIIMLIFIMISASDNVVSVGCQKVPGPKRQRSWGSQRFVHAVHTACSSMNLSENFRMIRAITGCVLAAGLHLHVGTALLLRESPELFGTVAWWFVDLIVEPLCIVGKQQLPHVRLVLLAHLRTESTFRACTQPAVVEHIKKAQDWCVPGTLNGISRLRVDYAERYRVEAGAHSVAADADQAEILHATVERTVQMPVDLFLSSAVCHAREVNLVKQHVLCRETHERNAVLELKT